MGEFTHPITQIKWESSAAEPHTLSGRVHTLIKVGDGIRITSRYPYRVQRLMSSTPKYITGL